MFWLFFTLSLLLSHNWIIGCCPSLGDIDGKDITKKRLAFVCQYFRSLFYDKKQQLESRGSFVSTRGCEGWNDRQNDDSLALSLCVSVIDPQFFVVLQLYFCQTNILSLCIVETLCVSKPSAFKPRLGLKITAHAKGRVREPKRTNLRKISKKGGHFLSKNLYVVCALLSQVK